MSLQCIRDTGLVAIIRGCKTKDVLQLVEALREGGVKAVEVACNTPGALEMIEQVRCHFGEKILVGAGTVLGRTTARLAILAGAEFLLSPNLSRDVIEVGNRYGKSVIPGVMTPTEIVKALQWGAKMVKVFPAATLGTGYIKDILGPISQAQLMAVGGISSSNAADFLKAGVSVLGIGSELVDLKLIQMGKYEEITTKAKKVIRIIAEARQGGLQ